MSAPAAGGDEAAAIEAVVQKIQRDVNCLADDNRNTRKRSLGKISKETIERKKEFSPTVLQALLNVVLKPVLKLYADPIEKCREEAITLISQFISAVPEPGEILPYLVPVLVGRLGQQEIVEAGEELRNQLILQVKLVLTTCKGGDGRQDFLAVYIDEWTQILTKTLLDPFHEVKKESCECVVTLSTSCPERFHMVSKSYVKPLIATMAHQHSKVRVACMRAVGAAIMHGENELINEFRVLLSNRTMDHSTSVRKALYEVMGSLLVSYKERYSFWHKLLPVILAGEADDVEEISSLARALFEKAGLLYEKENETDEKLKDQLDFGSKDASRPPLGCREIVRQNFSKIVPGVVGDLTDWSVDVRRQSAKLLHVLLRYEEGNVTMHLKTVLDGVYKAVQDDEVDIGLMVVKCAERIGSFVSTEVWCELLLPEISNSGLQPKLIASRLIVLGALIKGTPKGSLEPFVDKILTALSSNDISLTMDTEVQQETLLVVNGLVDTLGDAVRAHSYAVFAVLMRLHDPRVVDDVTAALARLSAACGLADSQALFDQHAHAFLLSLRPTCDSWTKASVEKQWFITLLSRAGPALGVFFDDIIPFFRVNFDVEKDVEMRLAFFTILGRLLSDPAQPLNTRGDFGQHAVTIVLDMISPNLAWKAGRTAGALRTAACSCLWALFHHNLVTEEHIGKFLSKLQPHLITALGDDFEQTRLITANVLGELLRVFRQGYQKDYQSYDQLHALYPEMMNRLDDNNDDIRKSILKAWLSFVRCMHAGTYDPQLYQAHIGAIYKTLLVHLDDPSTDIQEATKKVLLEAASVNPSMLVEHIEAVRHKHRSPKLCDEIATHAKTLIK